MNFTEAIFSAHPDEFGKRISVEQAVVYLIWLPEQAEIAEIGLTKLLEGYTHNAGGFNSYPTGFSTISAHKVKEREWGMALDFMMRQSVYFPNLYRRLRLFEAEVEEVQAAAEQAHQKYQQELDRELQEAIDQLHISMVSTNEDPRSSKRRRG